MVSAGTQACREDAAHRSLHRRRQCRKPSRSPRPAGPTARCDLRAAHPYAQSGAHRCRRRRRRRRRASRAGRARVKGVSRCGALGTRSATTARRRDAAPALSAISALSTVAVAWPPVHELVHELHYADAAHTHVIIGSARWIQGSWLCMRQRSDYGSEGQKVRGSTPFGCTTVIPHGTGLAPNPHRVRGFGS